MDLAIDSPHTPPPAEPTMPRNLQADDTPSDWPERKKKFKSIQVERDLAEMLKTVADADRKSIAQLVSLLMRRTVEERCRQVLEAKMKGLAGPAKKARRTG